MRIFRSWELTEGELRELLTRPFVDEVEVTAASPGPRQSGEHLSVRRKLSHASCRMRTRETPR